MADENDQGTTTSASGDDQGTSGDGATGSSTPGSDGGSQSDADQFAADRERLETRAREEQARADRLKAELDALRAAPSTSSTEAESGMTPEQIRVEIIRAQEIGSLAASLRTSEDFKYADKSILDNPARFESSEALRAAVEQSHNARKAFLDEVGVVPKSDSEAELAKYRERYGELPSPADTNGGSPTGTLTLAQVQGMSFAERDAYEAEHGAGSIERLINNEMRSA